MGGGIAGCALAYYLGRAGTETTLIERRDVNGQASSANAGSLHVQLTAPFFRWRQGDITTAVHNLGPLSVEAVRTWQDLAGTLDRDIELKIGGGLMIAETDDELRVLHDKAALERSAGLEVHVLPRDEVRSAAPYLSGTVVGAAFCPIEGKVNPLIATPALALAAARAGCRIQQGTELLALHRAGSGFVAETSRGPLRCHRVVNAAGGAATTVWSMVGLRVPTESRPQHMGVTEPGAALIPHLVQHVARRLTLKQAANGNVIIGGGHPATPAATNYTTVLRKSVEQSLWTAAHVVPALSRLQLIRTWAGESLMTDGQPILGPVPGVPGFYNAIPGNSGYTLGPICARLLAEAMTGKTPSLDLDAFSIARF